MVRSSRCRTLRTARRSGSQRFDLAPVLEASDVLVPSTRCDRGPGRGPLPCVREKTVCLRSQKFPHGAVLFTGTGIVPPDGFTLAAQDVVKIGISGIGRLENPVAVV